MMFGAIGGALIAVSGCAEERESTFIRVDGSVVGGNKVPEYHKNEEKKENKDTGQKPVLKEVVQNSAFMFIMDDGVAYACYDEYDMNISKGYSRLKPYLANKLLSDDANRNNVRVRISSDNNYGVVTINYMDPDEICLLWTETLDTREFQERIGLNPLGIVKAYKAKESGETNEASEDSTKG